MFKRPLLLLPDSCLTPLPTKLHALTHPPSLLDNMERLFTFDLDKSQMRGRYNWVRDVRRSHCQPFCACVFAYLEWAHACTLLIKRNCLVKIFCLLCACFQHQRVSNSNSLGAQSRILHFTWEEKSLALPWGYASCYLVAVALTIGQGWQLSGSVNELRLQNFLTK
jgi:hypothetical protein